MAHKRYSKEINTFHGREVPETGYLVGYGALIETLELAVPIPNQLAIISKKHKQYSKDGWLVFTVRHNRRKLYTIIWYLPLNMKV